PTTFTDSRSFVFGSLASTPQFGCCYIAMCKLVLIGLLIFAGCGSAPAPSVTKPAAAESQSDVAVVPLSQLDLAKIGAVAPKGRVQDTDYNHLPVVEGLIA